MRRFVVIGQTARGAPGFSLEDLPGSTGRLDVLLRCVQAALLVSHGLRRDTLVYLVLLGDPDAPRVVRVDGRAAEYVRPDERSLGGRVRNALEWSLSGEGFATERQGMAVASGGLDAVLADLGPVTPFVLEEGGRDVRASGFGGGEPAFFVGDHLGFDPIVRARLRELGATPLSVGPVSVHADDAITLVHNELDRQAGVPQTPARSQPPSATQ
jgi:tRNA (pseudouridine54-N1)-methyltransferase